jgi:hypothetical protein
MAKPTGSNVASPQGGKKDPKPIFVRPYQVMPAGSSKGCTYRFPQRLMPQRLLAIPK